MPLKKLLTEAYRDKYAIGAFNIYNLESARAVVAAAEAAKKPVILQVSEKAIEYAGLDELIFVVNNLKKSSKVDLFLHLDHGSKIELIKTVIKSGFDSVMFDGSKLPLDQNITISSELRKLAHKHSVVFEAEIGCIGGQEDFTNSSSFKTNPAEALMFQDQVKPDMLAVAIGNIHGVLTKDEQLDFSLLAKIQQTIKAPIVLHGCSNRAAQEYKVAISEGVVKINIDTELRQAFVEGVKKSIRHSIDPREILKSAEEEISKCTLEKIKIFSE